MAEEQARQSPESPLPQQTGDESDNESVGFNDPDTFEQFSRFENELKDELGSIASQVKTTILGMNEQMQQKFNDLDKQIQSIQTHLRDQNNNQGTTTLRNSTPLQLTSDHLIQTCNSPNTQSTDNSTSDTSVKTHVTFDHNLQSSNLANRASASNISEARVNNYIKLKPQTYTGSDDFEDFLTQFEITSEINGWDYKAKSLYLANSLTGAARALLNELDAEQRRDYKSLVQKLTERYGSENRAEVFRSQLKSRVKAKGESTAELAQAVRKLTRQAYPTVSLGVIEALSVDHFIDALPEAEIRLRLREVGPKTLAEAEKIAVRMEAHRIADKQRARLVCKIDQDNSAQLTPSLNTVEQQMSSISKRIDTLQRSVQNLTNQKNPAQPSYNGGYQHRTYNNQRPNRNSNYRNPNQRNYPYNGQNSVANQPYNQTTHSQANYGRQSENFRRSDQGSGSRLN